MPPRWLPLLVVLLAAACGAPSALDLESERPWFDDDRSDSYWTDRVWRTKDLIVCFDDEAIADASSEEAGWVMEAVTRTWQKESQLIFWGWGNCSATPGYDIRVVLDGSFVDSYGGRLENSRQRTVGIGIWVAEQVAAAREIMGPQVSSDRREVIQYTAVHEFGHALGLAHEHYRPEAPAECRARFERIPERTTVRRVRAYDPVSVMNYCSPRFLTADYSLSDGDITTIRALYGTPPSSER